MEIGAPPPPPPLHVGLVLDARRPALVDGPAATDAEGGRRWRALWGAKSETRRFQDGAIVAAVVWQGTGATRHSVLAQPLRHLLHLHLGVAPHAVRCSLDAVDAPLRAGGHSIASSASAAANDAFTKLAAAIRSLDGLPLAVTAVLPVGATFSHTEAFPPLPAAAGAPPAAGSPVLRFCVELEVGQVA